MSPQFDGVHVVSGSLDTSIRVWDVETGVCKHALMGHQSLTSGRPTSTQISLQNRVNFYTCLELKLNQPTCNVTVLLMRCPDHLYYLPRHGVEGQHLGVGQRRLHRQDLGHSHGTVSSNPLR